MLSFRVDHHAPSGCELQLRCEDKNVRVRLYTVMVIHPTKGTNTFYVLAENDSDAASMARCAARCAIYDVPKEVDELIRVHVSLLPLHIQGWGRTAV